MSLRLLCVVAVVSACGSKQSPKQSEANVVELRDAAMPAVAADAAAPAVDAPVAADAAPDAPEPAFTPPAALPPPAAATPASKTCRRDADADADHEGAREAAALDQALRAHGFTPLAVEADRMGGPLGPQRPPSPGTKAVRARRGQGFQLVVGTVAGCGGRPPIVAMDAKHEVFVVAPNLVARHERVVTECANTCRGVCGAQMPDRRALAAVPADAVLGQPRSIDVPLDTHVTFTFAKHVPCNIP